MFFPVIIIASLALAVGAVAFVSRQTVELPPLSRPGLLRAGLALVWVVLYLLLAETIGFVLTAFLLLMLIWRALGVRWLVALPLAACLAVGVYQLFAVWLRVPLPWGWLGW